MAKQKKLHMLYHGIKQGESGDRSAHKKEALNSFSYSVWLAKCCSFLSSSVVAIIARNVSQFSHLLENYCAIAGAA